MSLKAPVRHQLHTSARRALGEEEGDALMDALPPTPWYDFATKADLALAKQELLTALHTEIRTAITAHTRSFIFANVGILTALAGVFSTMAVILR